MTRFARGAKTELTMWFICEDVTAYYRQLPIQLRDRVQQLIAYPDGEIAIDLCENFYVDCVDYVVILP